MSSENLTEKEAEEVLRNFAESKANMHSFFTNVVKASDTTRTGNLNQDELGISNLPVRTLKELGVFCREVANQNEFGKYFDEISEVQTSSSLSKDGFLMKLVVTNKKEMSDMTPPRKENKSWFKKNEPTQTT